MAPSQHRVPAPEIEPKGDGGLAVMEAIKEKRALMASSETSRNDLRDLEFDRRRGESWNGPASLISTCLMIHGCCIS